MRDKIISKDLYNDSGVAWPALLLYLFTLLLFKTLLSVQHSQFEQICFCYFENDIKICNKEYAKRAKNFRMY